MNTQEYEELGKNNDSWYCIICNNVNYSTIVFSLHGLTASPTTNSSLDLDTSTSSTFNPLHTSTPTRASRQDKQKRRPLRFININFGQQGLVGKQARLANLVQSIRPDIIIGTESWLTSDHTDAEMFPSGFNIFRKDRTGKKGGGVFIAVLSELSSFLEPELATDCEILWVRIKEKGRRSILVSSFYHPHTHMQDSIKNFLESARRATTHQNATIIIGGDFNLPAWDWKTGLLKPTSLPNIHREFKDGIDGMGLVQMVQEETRGPNILDLYLTNQPSLVARVETTPGLSDHSAVYMEMQLNPPKTYQPRRFIPIYNKECEEPLRTAAEELNTQIMDKHNINSNINTLWEELNEGLQKACKDKVPHKLTKKKNYLPWINHKIKKMMRRRDRIHKRLKKIGQTKPNAKQTENLDHSLLLLVERLEKEIKELRSNIQKETRQSYWRYVEGTIIDSDRPGNTKRLYSFIKAKRTERQTLSPLKDDSGQLIDEPKEKAKILNKQFASVFNSKNKITRDEFEKKCPENNDHSKPIPNINELKITQNGVQKLLSSLDPHKAPGPDGLTPKLLKIVADQIAPSFTLLFQASLHQSSLPSQWKTAHITPIFKKGARYNPENYRPISLTSIACKMLEHIVTGHIMRHLESNDILCREQHGFRRGRSCATQLLGFVDEVSRELAGGHQVDTVVLDFSKAFDKVDHSLLLHKLARYGITGRVHSWIEDFLDERQQAVVVGGEKSAFLPVSSGVPQGSVLGPCLFLAYINDLPNTTETCTTRLFADDTMCHNKINTDKDQEKMQADLNALNTWEENWAMEFHPQKCENISLSRKQNTLPASYSLHGHTLTNTETATYLGVTIQQNLEWDKHIHTITNKANRTLGFLRRNLKIHNKKVKEQAYKTLVRPHLEYAAAVWDPHEKEDIDRIEQVQRRAARWVNNRYRRTSSVNDMLQDLAWPSLQERRKQIRLSTFYQYHHKLIHIDSKYTPTPSTQRLSRRQNNSIAYNIPPGTPNYRKNTFFPRTIPEWNHLPEEIVTAETLDLFKSRLSAMTRG